jgi:ABC-type multidrug transport system ATPase subunit/pSer/pThr/pTyr-binding forkhead associated (FHA) protein
MIVSRVHGWLKHIDDEWYYVENPDNMNGTFLNGTLLEKSAAGGRKPRIIKSGDVLRIDNKDLNHVSKDGVLMLFTTQPTDGAWTTFSLIGRASTVIGRDANCDIVESLPYLSAKHAKITFAEGRYYLSDCGSKAGTFLNGRPVEGSELLRERDYISICDCNYFFLGNRLLFKKSDRVQEQANLRQTSPCERPVILRADIETKRVRNNSGSGMKELIRDIHLEIRQGTLVALLGTAGAGKSTVMNCLNGMDLEGVQGSVLYRGVDLMKHFDQMKHLIGSVPQKKIFHPAFTPEKEFRIAARKRLPADMTDREIEERVDKTLEMLSMNGVRKNRNSKLSGGEQTRVNVGIELVADRDILCLDEPDQGLSPNYKHELFQIMRSLAHDSGKSVLSIIHDVSEIDVFDQVIMLAKVGGVGRLAFSGTPAEAREFFGVDIRDAYALLEREPERFVR